MSLNTTITLDRGELRSLIKEVLLEVLTEYNIVESPDELMNMQQAAAFLSLAVATLYEKTSERSIPHFKRGKKIMFKKSELLAWVESRKVTSSQEIKKDAAKYNTKQNTNVRDRYL